MSETPVPKMAKGKKKLLLPIAGVLVLLGLGAGGWFSGLIPKWLGKASPEHAEHAEKGEKDPAAGDRIEAARAPVFMDLPDIVANLNTGNRRPAFVKLKAKFELARAEDQPAVVAAMPRVLDLFQGYLREMRPDELRGTAGTYRLREELLARTNLVAPPAHVVAVLFTELIVQ